MAENLSSRGLADDVLPGGQAEPKRVVDNLASAQGQHATQPLIALEAGLSTVDKPELRVIQSEHRDVSSGARAEGPQLRLPDFPRGSDGRSCDDLRQWYAHGQHL